MSPEREGLTQAGALMKRAPSGDLNGLSPAGWSVHADAARRRKPTTPLLGTHHIPAGYAFVRPCKFRSKYRYPWSEECTLRTLCHG